MLTEGLYDSDCVKEIAWFWDVINFNESAFTVVKRGTILDRIK